MAPHPAQERPLCTNAFCRTFTQDPSRTGCAPARAVDRAGTGVRRQCHGTGDRSAAVQGSRAGAALPAPHRAVALHGLPERNPGRLQRQPGARHAPRSVSPDATGQDRRADQAIPGRPLLRLRAVRPAGATQHVAAVVRAVAGPACRCRGGGGQRTQTQPCQCTRRTGILGAAGDGRADIGPEHTGPDNIGDDW